MRRLKTSEDVRRALAAIVNQHESGDLPDQKALRLSQMLGVLLKACAQVWQETHIQSLEARLEAIEAKVG